MSPSIPRRRPVQWEDHEQIALMRWAHLYHVTLELVGEDGDIHVECRPLSDLLVAIPNHAYLHGNARQRAQQWARLRQMGAKAGVHDILLPLPAAGYHGLWLELKARKEDQPGARPSVEQVAWAGLMQGVGYRAEIVHGWEPARDIIQSYVEEGGYANRVR